MGSVCVRACGAEDAECKVRFSFAIGGSCDCAASPNKLHCKTHGETLESILQDRDCPQPHCAVLLPKLQMFITCFHQVPRVATHGPKAGHGLSWALLQSDWRLRQEAAIPHGDGRSKSNRQPCSIGGTNSSCSVLMAQN